MFFVMSQINNFKMDIPVLINPTETPKKSLTIFCLFHFNILKKCIYKLFKYCKKFGL